MEEQPELPNPNANTNKKHLAMLERLSNRHQSLPHKSNAASFESTSAFLSQFAESKNSIESQLAQCRITDPAQLKPQLDAVSQEISDLEKLVAESSYYLASYDVRSSLKTISDLKQSLESLIPKKKFSFKSKPTKKTPIAAPLPQSEPEKVNNNSPSAPPSYALPSAPGFTNRVGEVLVKDFKGSEIGEFSISDLQSCEVRLLGSARALFVNRLRDCKVFAGPVTGSILIDEAENCVFVVASHQIRIHNAKTSDFYLRVRSRPIIEDCNGVRFAPYCLSYQGIDEDLRESNLAEETGNWAVVDDFKWLKAVQSPNWSVLPENERIEAIEIANAKS